jgi:aminomethyltransferase
MATLAPSGLLVVDRAIERYPVRPDGVTAVALRGDDELRIIDRYGGQVAELTVTGAGFGIGEPRSERLFGPESAPGSTVSFTAVGDTSVTVAAPGGRVIDGDAPATELALEVRRATPREAVEAELPPLLAEPRLDFRIDPASAQSYEVREGEYIQIIDVRGKQCSDFLAFNAA